MPKNNIKKISLKDGPSLELEIILNPLEKDKKEKEKIVSEMKEVTKKSWSDFKEVTYKWFELADMIFILRDKNKKPVAFSANKFIDEKLIIFLSTMVLPEFQGYGIAKKMQKIAGQKFLRDQILKNSLKFWKNFKSLYFAYRTPNPRLIKAVQKYNLALPIDNSKKISDKEKIIAKKVAEIFSPNLEFEEKNFVIKSALLKTNPELIYKKDQIPWSGDEKIDKFCENHLDYKNQKGNLFVIVGHINFFQKIFFACIPL